MSIALRVLLLVASILTCGYIARKLKKSQVQVMDTVFWIGLSVFFIVLSIFPDIAVFFSDYMGTDYCISSKPSYDVYRKTS